MDQGCTLGGGGGRVSKNKVVVHNSIVIFGKSGLGGILIVQLCIFSCKDKAMVGYNVLEMYLKIIGIFFWHSNSM